MLWFNVQNNAVVYRPTALYTATCGKSLGHQSGSWTIIQRLSAPAMLLMTVSL